MIKNFIQINIKPISVNRCWQGRRFKTKDYKIYEEEMFYILHNKKIQLYEKMAITIIVGYSSRLADLDNFCKPFLDILQKKFEFNDRDVYKLILEKEIVKKGEEFIKFNISEYRNN